MYEKTIIAKRWRTLIFSMSSVSSLRRAAVSGSSLGGIVLWSLWSSTETRQRVDEGGLRRKTRRKCGRTSETRRRRVNPIWTNGISRTSKALLNYRTRSQATAREDCPLSMRKCRVFPGKPPFPKHSGNFSISSCLLFNFVIVSFLFKVRFRFSFCNAIERIKERIEIIYRFVANLCYFIQNVSQYSYNPIGIKRIKI